MSVRCCADVAVHCHDGLTYKGRPVPQRAGGVRGWAGQGVEGGDVSEILWAVAPTVAALAGVWVGARLFRRRVRPTYLPPVANLTPPTLEELRPPPQSL